MIRIWRKWPKPIKPSTLLTSFVLVFSLSRGLAFGETFKVAFIDTGFCPKELPQSITIKYFDQDLSNIVCANKDPRAWHGQEVLKTFLKDIKLVRGERLHLYLYSVFNKRGEQDLKLWQKTLKLIEKEKISWVFMALGLPIEASKDFVLPLSTFFVSAGQVGTAIASHTKLWPHELSLSQVKLVGAWQKNNKGEFYQDPLHLYQEKLSFVQIIPSPKLQDKLAHTSLALALFAGRAWDLCRFDFACLEKKLKPHQKVLISE